jgi:hypothetical protein
MSLKRRLERLEGRVEDLESRSVPAYVVLSEEEWFEWVESGVVEAPVGVMVKVYHVDASPDVWPDPEEESGDE